MEVMSFSRRWMKYMKYNLDDLVIHMCSYILYVKGLIPKHYMSVLRGKTKTNYYLKFGNYILKTQMNLFPYILWHAIMCFAFMHFVRGGVFCSSEWNCIPQSWTTLKRVRGLQGIHSKDFSESLERGKWDWESQETKVDSVDIWLRVCMTPGAVGVFVVRQIQATADPQRWKRCRGEGGGCKAISVKQGTGFYTMNRWSR